MRAVLIREHGAPESLRVEEIATPVCGDSEALVDVHAVGVNFPDLLVIEGKYQVLPPRPFSPGKDAAGVVRAVGSKVTLVQPGDRVMVCQEHGCYAEQLVAHEDNCHRMPEAMSFAEAAAMGLRLSDSILRDDRARQVPIRRDGAGARRGRRRRACRRSTTSW